MVIFDQRPIMKTSKKSSTHQTCPLAAWLVDQHATRLTFAPTPTAFAPTSASEAVAVQNAFVNIKARQCGPTVGWKIALATPTMQKLVGLDAPIAGRLHRRQVVYAPANLASTILTVEIGFAMWLVFVGWAHGWLIGVQVFP